MRLRLADDIVAGPELRAWIPRPAGPMRLADESDASPGAAIALGPAEATAEQIRHAVIGLTRLVTAGGVVAAGARVDLGAGFRSARLAGARGDQRDAVLAALKVLGVENADRLGDRAGFLVALFGPAVTKRVGAAAARAITEGRWAAVHLASAASDVLGPEQLERTLTLTGPDGADLIAGGLPSTLAAHLAQALEPVPRPRRSTLLIDLWARVSEHHAELARRERLLASQGRENRVDALRARREHYEDELILRRLRSDLPEPSLADAARWRPSEQHWFLLLNRLLHDALAATALLRTAVAVSDHGIEGGLEQSETLLRAAAGLTGSADPDSARRVSGLTGLPARPGHYTRALHRRLRTGPGGPKLAAYVRERLAHARNYALIVIEEIEALLAGSPHVPEHVLKQWIGYDLRGWRAEIGYTSVRPPAEWGEVPFWVRQRLNLESSLARRLEDRRDPDVASVEQIGDLLWYAELADALALLHGHDAAKVTPEVGPRWLDHDPAPEPPEPLTPRLDSITLAVSGAAQLVALGCTPPRGVGTWTGFTDGLRADARIAEALSGEFSVPAPLTAVDGTIVPGTGARFRVARDARTLAEWSDYMGNCIAGPGYLENAKKGRCGLAALYDPSGRIVANVELRPARPSARGWLVTEMAARFNDTPEESLEREFRHWVGTIPGPVASGAPSAPPAEEAWQNPSGRRRVTPRLLEEAGPVLEERTGRAWADQVTAEVAAALAALAGTAPGTAPDAALTRLRRMGFGRLADVCRDALDEGRIDLAELWTVTGVRPLDTAVHALDPAMRDRFERLALLLDDTSLPKALRVLVKGPAVAPAYSMGLVGRRVRAAIGRLVHDGDPVIARAVGHRVTPDPLCALVVATTCRSPAIELAAVAPPRTVTVPGFPATSLADEEGPWRRVFPAARELGADTTVFWDRIAEHGLRIPAGWLGPGGWTALWSRAHGSGR